MGSAKENFVVFGDNLDIMSRLEGESFDLIFLDPPWNINNFIYPDQEDEKEYQEFIFKVIQQCHRLLKSTGNLVVYSNPSLNVNFHDLIRPIFNFSNFKAEIIIPRKKINFSKDFSHNHETVLFYSKSNLSNFFPYIDRSEKEIETTYPLEENGHRYRLEPLSTIGKNAKFNFEWNGFPLPEGRVWRYSQKKLDQLEKENKIFYKKDLVLPRLKRFYKCSQKMMDSVWTDIEPYYNDPGTKNYSPSQKMLKRIIEISSQKGATILDPFTGRGVSGIVSQEIKRKWVGIEKTKDFYLNSSVEYKKFTLENFVKENAIVWDDYIPYNLSEVEILKQRISGGENQRLEFKEAYIYNSWEQKKDKELPDKIMKEIAGFLNSEYGGSILLGVNDKGGIRGLLKDFEYCNPQKSNYDACDLSISSKIKSTFSSKILEFIKIIPVELDEKTICEIKISPSKTPIFFNGNYILRQGTKAQLLTSQEMVEILISREIIKYDTTTT